MAGRRPTQRSQEWTASVLNAYQNNQPIIRIAAYMGVSEKTIARTLRAHGVEIRPR